MQGRISDGGVFKNTSVYEKFLRNTLNLPLPAALLGRTIQSPYVFVADNAFHWMNMFWFHSLDITLKTHSNAFSDCTARRIVENVFGILCAIFRVLHTKIHLNTRQGYNRHIGCSLPP